MDSYGKLRLLLQGRGVKLPLGRAVSLGCGFGALERGLAAQGIITEIDAYDFAPAAIAEAKRLAATAGLSGLRYHVADLDNEMDRLPRGADVVFAHSSVHHVTKLEELFAAVADMLKPGGIFHLNEFVGPTRFQWTDAQIAAVNDFLESLPPRLRRLPSGQPRPLQTRPSVADMIAADPSEAVRSAEIVPLLSQYFDILEVRELGGALLHLGLADIAQNFNPESAEDQAVLETFFAAEDRAMRDGTVGSDFAIITAVARPHAPTPRMDSPATMPRSLATRLSLLFPPAQRLHHAVRALNQSVDWLMTENRSLRAEQARLANRVSELAAPAAPTMPPPPAPGSITSSIEMLDRMTERELQAASLRYLPFLPGDIAMADDGLHFVGYAGAPNGLTDNMAFFVNGWRFDRVEYPVLDKALASRFPEVRGMGLTTRMIMTEHLDELRSTSFWRLDASPVGHYVAANWRQAIHFKNSAFELYPLLPRRTSSE